MKSEHRISLTQAQREELKRALEEKRSQLQHALRQHEVVEDALEAASSEREPGDPADLAEAATGEHERISLADRDLDLLEEVDAALGRFAEGTYGMSEITGRPIPYERLRLVPWTRYEADEAERIEHQAARH